MKRGALNGLFFFTNYTFYSIISIGKRGTRENLMSLFDETSVRAIGTSMTIYPTGERSILIDILCGTLPLDVLRDVRDARLEYVESFFTTVRTIAARYRLTVKGGSVRCAIVQNLIKATVLGDETQRQRLINVANQ